MTSGSQDSAGEVERHLEALIVQQREKVLRLARRRLPHLTNEDILNPHDFPELVADPNFNFEDGILAGLLQAQMSLRVALRNDGSPSDDMERP